MLLYFDCMPWLLWRFWVDAGVWFCVWVAVFLSSVSQHACQQWAHCLELNSPSRSHSSPPQRDSSHHHLIGPTLSQSQSGTCVSRQQPWPHRLKSKRCLDLGGRVWGFTSPDQTAAQCWNLIVCFHSNFPQLDVKAPQSHFDFLLVSASVWQPAGHWVDPPILVLIWFIILFFCVCVNVCLSL